MKFITSLLFFSAILTAQSQSQAQHHNKDDRLIRDSAGVIKILWQSNDYFDSAGTLFRIRVVYDHIPNKSDSLNFDNNCRKEALLMMKQVKNINGDKQRP